MQWNSGFYKESHCNYVHFIMMKTVIFIYMGRNTGLANVETYRDRQGHTGIDRARQEQAGTDRDIHGRTGTDRDRQVQTGTDKDRQERAEKSKD